MIKRLQGSIMLLIAAIIWGTAFVAQSEGMKYIEPFTYGAIRMFIGGIVLIPVIILFNKFSKNCPSKKDRKVILKTTVKGGICCGFVLFTASSIQQSAISGTTAGKAGFITALYIVIVPLIKLVLLRNKTDRKIWFYVLMAMVGFYLLCITNDFFISKSDLLMLACAFFFAMHIIVIDYFNEKGIDGILLSCIQFFVAGTLALTVMLIFEHPQINNIMEAKYTILYAGLLSSGIAYTLQILGQQHTDPTVATLIMSLESVFAAVSGCIILDEKLSLREGIGCLMVFTAVILAQLNIPDKYN